MLGSQESEGFKVWIVLSGVLITDLQVMNMGGLWQIELCYGNLTAFNAMLM